MNKKAEGVAYVLLIGMISLFFILVVFAAFTPAFEHVRDAFNSSFTGEELTVSGHINRAWSVAFIVLGFSVIVMVVLSALSRQSKEYYR